MGGKGEGREGKGEGREGKWRGEEGRGWEGSGGEGSGVWCILGLYQARCMCDRITVVVMKRIVSSPDQPATPKKMPTPEGPEPLVVPTPEGPEPPATMYLA